MKPGPMYVVGAVFALSLVAGAAALYSDQEIASGNATGDSLAGISAGMRFNDEQGNARMPTEAERAALAEAFQADIANLTRGKRAPAGEQRQRDGSYRAVVGAKKAQFLTVSIDDDGKATFGHSSMDESGQVEPASANDLPEM